MAACVLANGAIRIFASDAKGNLWTIWQTPVDLEGEGPWIESWRESPLPGKDKIHVQGALVSDIDGLSNYGSSLAFAQNADGTPQLFALFENRHVWTKWMTSWTDPHAWTPWIYIPP